MESLPSSAPSSWLLGLPKADFYHTVLVDFGAHLRPVSSKRGQAIPPGPCENTGGLARMTDPEIMSTITYPSDTSFILDMPSQLTLHDEPRLLSTLISSRTFRFALLFQSSNATPYSIFCLPRMLNIDKYLSQLMSL